MQLWSLLFPVSFTRHLLTSPVGFFCVLPREVIIHVLSFLDIRSLVKCSQVCRDFKQFSSYDPLFKGICEKNGWDKVMKKPDCKTWKWLCHCQMVDCSDLNGVSIFRFSFVRQKRDVALLCTQRRRERTLEIGRTTSSMDMASSLGTMSCWCF